MAGISRNGLVWNLGRVGITLAVVAIVAALAFLGFVWYPSSLAGVFGVLLFAVVAVAGFKLAGKVRESVFPSYNVAEVPIVGGVHYPGGMPTLSFGDAGNGNKILEHIERADRDDSVEALVIRLNTTGGEMSPSEDVLAAIKEFDGPTFAYIDDWCASAGYWIAIGCDEVWSHYGSMVGSIGVQFSQIRASGLADRLGIEYVDISSGKYKNALGGSLPIMDVKEHERELLQTVSDGHYDQFVQRVAEERDLDEQHVRDTEGAFYRGERCVDLGLVDEVGTQQEFERALERKLDADEVEIERFDSDGGVLSVVGGGARATASAFGSGVAATVLDALGLGSKPR